MTANIVDDGFVKLVASHFDGFAVDDSAQRDNGHTRSTAAHVHNHATCGFCDGESRANSCRHRLFDQVNLARACGVGAFFHGPLLHLRDPVGHTDDDARTDEAFAARGV